MAGGDDRQEQPDWAVSGEHRPDGRTVFRDEGGEPRVALAVTGEDLRRLRSGLQELPGSPAVSALQERLATLHADLDEVAR